MEEGLSHWRVLIDHGAVVHVTSEVRTVGNHREFRGLGFRPQQLGLSDGDMCVYGVLEHVCLSPHDIKDLVVYHPMTGRWHILSAFTRYMSMSAYGYPFVTNAELAGWADTLTRETASASEAHGILQARNIPRELVNLALEFRGRTWWFSVERELP